MKLGMLINATVVDDAIMFVTSNANFNSVHNAQANKQQQQQQEGQAVVIITQHKIQLFYFSRILLIFRDFP